MKWLRWPTLILATAIIGLAIEARDAEATNVTLRVTIETLRTNCYAELLGCGEADFRIEVTIAGEVFTRDGPEDDDEPAITFSSTKTVDSGSGPVPVQIRVFDRDAPPNDPDDPFDVQQGGDDNLDLLIDLVPCGVGGEITGACDTRIVSSGESGNAAEIGFRVLVLEHAGLLVRCLHVPLIPQPGESLRIDVRALDSDLFPRAADDIQIWFDGQLVSDTPPGRTSHSFTVTTPDAPSFSYGCRVEDEGLVAFSGWRTVTIGPPVSGEATPLIYTGPRNERIDVVFIADGSSYTGENDPNFMSDVRQIMPEWAFDEFWLNRQGKFNFWIAPGTGAARGLVPPPNWDTVFAFADAGAILHRQELRDGASPTRRLLTSTSSDPSVLQHELGHVPFGLADEYCCDGGYYQASPFPNLYEAQTDCLADAPTVGAVGCRSYTEGHTLGRDWFTSDPPNDDQMADMRTPRPLDLRRIDWMLAECAAGNC